MREPLEQIISAIESINGNRRQEDLKLSPTEYKKDLYSTEMALKRRR